MKLPRAVLLVLLPSVATAWPVPPLPQVQLDAPPLTLVRNALEQLPKVMDTFGADLRAAGAHPVTVSHMPILVPAGGCDPKLIHAPDPSVDYKLTILDPEVGEGK